jgi:hypothetical protein
MTPEEALRNILTLVDGAEEIEDVRALHILLESINTLAEKGLTNDRALRASLLALQGVV